MTELPHGLSGTAGEYYTAAELSRRGYLATITNRNAPGVDILAAKPGSGKALKIQVKTIQGRANWVLGHKCEQDYGPGYFYIFVNLTAAGIRPYFHIVPCKIVAEFIKKRHIDYLKGKKRDGSDRKDSKMRTFSDATGAYKEAWHLLDEE